MNSFCFGMKCAQASPAFRSTFATPTRPVLLPSIILIEEELAPDYDPRQHYPVNPGEILINKYEMTAKLGYGSGSTVWLAKDIKRYVLKSSFEKIFSILTDNYGDPLVT